MRFNICRLKFHFLYYNTLFSHRNLWRDCKEAYKPVHVDPSASDKEMEFVLDELINKYSLSSHPNEVCLFLLSSYYVEIGTFEFIVI